MTTTRSPGLTPMPASALAKRFERSPSWAKVKRRGWPSADTQSSASFDGSRPHASKVSKAQLNRAGTSSLKLRIVAA